MKGLGPAQKKLLILLVGATSMGLTYSFSKQLWILKQMGREWNKVNRQALRRAIESLYKRKLIDIKENSDGSTQIFITKSGKIKSLVYDIDKMTIKKPKIWDKKWRMVIFDIPENYKKAREAMRRHLKNLGFYQLQKSVFVFPFECENEIDFVIEYFNVRSYVRLVLAGEIDNSLHLRKIFNI